MGQVVWQAKRWAKEAYDHLGNSAPQHEVSHGHVLAVGLQDGAETGNEGGSQGQNHSKGVSVLVG